MTFLLIKKVLTALILPLGLFILVTAICGLFLIMKRNRTGQLLILMGLSLYAFSISPVSDLLLTPLERHYPLKDDVHGDVIVILGGGINESAPDFSGQGFASEEALARIICGYRLWKRLDEPIIVSGGGFRHGQQREARVAKRILVDLGVPKEMVIEEAQSKDTFENSYYTERIIEEKGFKSPVLVTSAYHMTRAVFAFKELGVSVTPFPCDFKSKPRDYDVRDFLPNAERLNASSKALKEYFGLIAYRLGIF